MCCKERIKKCKPRIKQLAKQLAKLEQENKKLDQLIHDIPYQVLDLARLFMSIEKHEYKQLNINDDDEKKHAQESSKDNDEAKQKQRSEMSILAESNLTKYYGHQTKDLLVALITNA